VYYNYYYLYIKYKCVLCIYTSFNVLYLGVLVAVSLSSNEGVMYALTGVTMSQFILSGINKKYKTCFMNHVVIESYLHSKFRSMTI